MELELVDQWRRVEGFLVSKETVHEKVISYLKELNILACVDWYDETQTVTISVMENDGQIAGCLDNKTIAPVCGYEELVEKLGEKFQANVDFEDYNYTSFDDFDEYDEICEDDFEEYPYEEETKVNCAVITRTPASVFPFISNMEDTKIGVAELEHDRRIVLQSEKSFMDISVIESCDTPYLAFYENEGQYFFIYSPTDDALETISYTWSENVELIYGSLENPSKQIQKVVRDVLSPYNVETTIAGISEEISLENVSKALSTTGEKGMGMLLAEFGVPAEIIDFMHDKKELSELSGVVVHEPRGYSNAVKRFFNTTDKKKHSVFWKNYYNLSVEKPWVLNIFAGVVGVTGAMLFTNALRSEKTNTKSTLGAILGILLMVEGVAEYMLNKYIGIREESNRRENNDW